MALTLADIIVEFDKRVGDESTDRISTAERYDYFTQSVAWLKERTLNDHSVNKYDFNYYDTLHYYKVTTVLDDLLEGNAMTTKMLQDAGQPFTRKSAEELRAEIGYDFMESSYSIERRNGDAYLVVNHDSKYRALLASSCDSLTGDGDTWEVDSTNSDATNLSVNTEDYTQGTGSFSFDLDVSQSGNNKGTIFNDGLTSEDLSDEKDITTWLIDVRIPDATYVSSYTFAWGNDSSNYYSVTSTTDANGNAFVDDEWITLSFDWNGATETGTVDDTAIDYIAVTVNYTASQGDDTSFKVDNIRLVRPEKLQFHYTSWSVGKDTNGTDILEFSASTDVPYFSGQYDQYKYATAYYAAAMAFRDMRLFDEADRAEVDAERAINRIDNLIPKSVTRETKSFKPKGISWRRGRRVRRLR